MKTDVGHPVQAGCRVLMNPPNGVDMGECTQKIWMLDMTLCIFMMFIVRGFKK